MNSNRALNPIVWIRTKWRNYKIKTNHKLNLFNFKFTDKNQNKEFRRK